MNQLEFEKLDVIAVLILFFVCYSIVNAEEGLVAHWSFDENGDQAKDNSHNENVGKVIGSPKRVAGVKGQALEFDKKKKTHVQVADNKSLDIINSITIEAWINPKSVYIGNDWKHRNCVLGKPTAYYLDINEKGNLASYLYGAQPQEWLVGQTNMEKFIGKWVHIATVYDGKNHTLYINGKPEKRVGKKGKIRSVDRMLEIGWVDNERYFDGLIDEVKLWNRALSRDELTAASTLVVEPLNKLSLLWSQIKLAE